MTGRPMLLHRLALVSFRLFCKNLGNLYEFLGQMVYRPPWPKIASTPMGLLMTNKGNIYYIYLFILLENRLQTLQSNRIMYSNI